MSPDPDGLFILTAALTACLRPPPFTPQEEAAVDFSQAQVKRRRRKGTPRPKSC